MGAKEKQLVVTVRQMLVSVQGRGAYLRKEGMGLGHGQGRGRARRRAMGLAGVEGERVCTCMRIIRCQEREEGRERLRESFRCR